MLEIAHAQTILLSSKYPFSQTETCTEVTRTLNHKCIQELLHARYIICGIFVCS